MISLMLNANHNINSFKSKHKIMDQMGAKGRKYVKIIMTNYYD